MISGVDVKLDNHSNKKNGIIMVLYMICQPRIEAHNNQHHFKRPHQQLNQQSHILPMSPRHDTHGVVLLLLAHMLTSGAFLLTPSTTTTKVTLSSPIRNHYFQASVSIPSPLAAADTDNEDFHPEDPASTTPQLLKGIWDQIAQALSMERGVSHDK